jgi:hypothetical protein
MLQFRSPSIYTAMLELGNFVHMLSISIHIHVKIQHNNTVKNHIKMLVWNLVIRPHR